MRGEDVGVATSEVAAAVVECATTDEAVPRLAGCVAAVLPFRNITTEVVDTGVRYWCLAAREARYDSGGVSARARAKVVAVAGRRLIGSYVRISICAIGATSIVPLAQGRARVVGVRICPSANLSAPPLANPSAIRVGIAPICRFIADRVSISNPLVAGSSPAGRAKMWVFAAGRAPGDKVGNSKRLPINSREPFVKLIPGHVGIDGLGPSVYAALEVVDVAVSRTD